MDGQKAGFEAQVAELKKELEALKEASNAKLEALKKASYADLQQAASEIESVSCLRGALYLPRRSTETSFLRATISC